jgi:hypothetical protein
MADIGKPIKKYVVVPLHNPVPATPEPKRVAPLQPVKEPAKEDA